jgi:hypothetical protein
VAAFGHLGLVGPVAVGAIGGAVEQHGATVELREVVLGRTVAKGGRSSERPSVVEEGGGASVRRALLAADGGLRAGHNSAATNSSP